jgi:hypothetical protein
METTEMQNDLETATRAALATLLWTDHDDSTGEYLDSTHSPEDFTEYSKTRVRKEMAKFLESIPECEMSPFDLGCDFILTRNGHGAGFWDRGLGDLGDELTRIATTFPQIHAYINDDNKIDTE